MLSVVYMTAIQKEKYQNGCLLKTTSQHHYIFNVHIWETYIHMFTKNDADATNDGQFMIV